ncbi:hypothetical protein Tco_0600797 [Tanacetum coccineum]
MDKEASSPTVTIKAKMDVVKEIREALTPTQVEIFEKTCFGHWLDIWTLEAIPATHRFVHKKPTEKILRALAWELRIPFSCEPLEIEKDGISEKKKEGGSSQSSLQDPTYDQLMTIVTKLEGTVATLTETVSSLHGAIGTLESRLLALEVMHVVMNVTLESCQMETYQLTCHQTKGKSVETQFDRPSVVRQPNAQRIPKPSVLGKPAPFSNSPEMRSFQTKQSVNKTNVSDGFFKPVTPQNLPQNRNQAVRNTNVLKPGMYRIATTTTQNREAQLPRASRNTNPYMSKSSGVNHTTSVSRPQLKCYQVKDKVVPNNSQVKFKKKEVEDHHRFSSISKKTKFVTACNDSSKSRTLNVNAVCAEYGKYVFNSNHDACFSRYLNDLNARTKKPKVVPISASKPKRKRNKSVVTPHKKTVASDTTIQKSKSYYKELYENTNQEWKWKDDESTSISPTIDIVSRITNIVQLILFIVDSGCTKHMTGNLKLLCNSVEKFLGLVLHQMTSDHNRSELGIQDHSNEPSSSKLVPKVVPLAVKTATSRQELELLFHHHIAMPRTTAHEKDSVRFQCAYLYR